MAQLKPKCEKKSIKTTNTLMEVLSPELGAEEQGQNHTLETELMPYGLFRHLSWLTGVQLTSYLVAAHFYVLASLSL